MISIRPATEADLNQLSELFDLYRVFYRKSSDIPAARNFLHERFKSNDSCVFVAADEDRLVGFTQLYSQLSSTRMKKFWVLNDLFVKVEYRGRGISKMLIDAAKEKAKETGGLGLMLETEKTNMIGNQLYPATGFSLIDSNFYWWDNKA